ncbi:MAG: extracellular solute-binding protein [Synechococcaceae cyanobacterium RL_1_2]|nr:extracellular solute-binding protein [Synechococcaceae cyanobacterium RL_1_2]
MNGRRQFLKSSLGAAAGLTLTSCGWRLANVKAPSPSSGSNNELYIYTWAGYTDEDLLKLFEERTGIRAVADVFDSNESMLARIQASGGGSYSIIYPSDYMVRQMAEEEMLTPLDKSKILGLENLFPNFQDPPYDRNNSYSLPLSWGTTGLLYNRSKLKEAPQDWNYLWENKDLLRKKFTLLNDVREVMGATLKMLGYSYNSINPQEIAAAYNQLQELKSSIASFSSDAWRTQILSGDLLVAMVYSSDAHEVMSENEDLAYVLPTSGSSLWTDSLVIPKTAPNPDGAYQWMNFMLEPEIAARICETLSFAIPNKPGYELLPPELANDYSLYPPEPALTNSEGLEPLPDEINDLYDRYWTRLTSS